MYIIQALTFSPSFFMKKFLSLCFVAVFLASCTLPFTKKAPLTPQDGDTVSVQYVGTFDDGTIFDSSRKEGRTPMEFTIGRKNMIQGFEDAVHSMKIGETKKIRLEAKDAYGEEYMQKTIPLDQYKDVIEQKVLATDLTGHLEQKFTKAQVETVFVPFAVGTEKKIGEATLKILAITGNDVIVSINEPKAPFAGKKLAVDMKATTQDGSEITIKKITGNDVDIVIKQKQEILSKTDKEITVKVKNPHPLAGKALNFEIELLTIKKSDSH